MKAATIPLHDVVVADQTFVKKATDTLQIPRSGTPSFFGLARGASETPIVVRQETAKDLIGGIQIGGVSQT